MCKSQTLMVSNSCQCHELCVCQCVYQCVCMLLLLLLLAESTIASLLSAALGVNAALLSLVSLTNTSTPGTVCVIHAALVMLCVYCVVCDERLSQLQLSLQFTLSPLASMSTPLLMSRLTNAQGGITIKSQPSVQRLSSECTLILSWYASAV